MTTNVSVHGDQLLLKSSLFRKLSSPSSGEVSKFEHELCVFQEFFTLGQTLTKKNRKLQYLFLVTTFWPPFGVYIPTLINTDRMLLTPE